MLNAYSIKIRGVVQGVGFRPFVYRLARTNGLTGWVLNEEEGVEIHLEGEETTLRVFIEELKTQPPPASSIVTLRVMPAEPSGCTEFLILTSQRQRKPTVRVSPDLPVCEDCLREVFDPQNRRYHYPYTHCTNCGPRYTVIESLPYDRCNTTMKKWPLDDYCVGEYGDPANRRFHAQPGACPDCVPQYYFQQDAEIVRGDSEFVRVTVQRLNAGDILAIKGLGGYHLVCDARNAKTVSALRMRKYRKEKPFALMAADI